MADVKITDLPEATEVADDDQVLLIDVSDNTAGPNGTDKRSVLARLADLLYKYDVETAAELEASSPVIAGRRAICRERAHANYILAAEGYTALPGDIVAANGRVWELLIVESTTVDSFGGKGDWNPATQTGTDSTTAILASVSRLGGFKLEKDGKYQVTQSIAVNNGGLIADLNGSTLIQNGSFDLISAVQDFTDVQYISSFDYECIIDLSKGQGGSTTETTSLTVPDASGYSAGDFVKVYSDDLLDGIAPDNKERVGEFAKIAAVNGNEIILYCNLHETYTTNPRVARMGYEHRVKIFNGTLDIDGSVNPTYNGAFIHLSGCLFSEVKNLEVARTRSEAIEYLSCLGHATDNIKAIQINSDFDNIAYGYLIIDYSSANGVHRNLHAYDGRHVYTTGTRSTELDDSRPERYGPARDFLVVNSIGRFCQYSAFDTHYDSRGGMFLNCIAEQAYKGPRGTYLNFQLRGQGGVVANCQSVGGTGYRINGAYDVPNAGKNNKIVNCQHTFLPEVDVNMPAIDVLGSSATNKVKNAKIINCEVKVLQGEARAVETEFAEVDIVNLDVEMKSDSDGNGEILRINEESTVHIEGGVFDYREPLGQYLRAVRIVADNSFVTMKNSTIRGLVSTICDMNNTNSVFRGTNIHLDTEPTNAAGIVDVGAGGSALVDYKVNDGVSGSRALADRHFYTGGDKTLELEYRGSPEVFISVTCDDTVATTRVLSIEDGAFYGQILSIQCHYNSAAPLYIYEGSIKVGADRTIAQGDCLRLMWDGAYWVGA